MWTICALIKHYRSFAEVFLAERGLLCLTRTAYLARYTQRVAISVNDSQLIVRMLCITPGLSS